MKKVIFTIVYLILFLASTVIIGKLANTSSSVQAASQSVAVSADGHWLEFQGKRLLLIGDSVTQGWMELGTDFNQNGYVDALASRGVNVILIWSYIGIIDQVADSRIGYNAPEIWPWSRSGSLFNLNSLNQSYFDRLRSFVSYANSKGIVVIITIHDGWTKGRWDGHPFNSNLGGLISSNSSYVTLNANTTMNLWVDRLITSTADLPNVMYEIFNEGEWYDQTKLATFQSYFLSRTRGMTGRPLLVNDDHVAKDFRSETDIISLHFPHWDTATSAKTAFDYYLGYYNGSPARPIFFTEPVPAFAGGSSERTDLMRLMWGTDLGGGGFVVQNDTSFGFAPNAAINPDYTMLDLEGYAAKFFNKSGVDLNQMTPDPTLCSTGVCMGKKGVEYIVYSQSGTSFTVDISGSADTFIGRFYNPATGQFQAEFSVLGGSTARSFNKPSGSDWVLHLRKGSAGPTLTPTPCIKQGDANGDCRVDGYDYVIWWQNFGRNVSGGPSQGDFNNSGFVDGYDYVIWWMNFGR